MEDSVGEPVVAPAEDSPPPPKKARKDIENETSELTNSLLSQTEIALCGESAPHVAPHHKSQASPDPDPPSAAHNDMNIVASAHLVASSKKWECGDKIYDRNAKAYYFFQLGVGCLVGNVLVRPSEMADHLVSVPVKEFEMPELDCIVCPAIANPLDLTPNKKIQDKDGVEWLFDTFGVGAFKDCLLVRPVDGKKKWTAVPAANFE